MPLALPHRAGGKGASPGGQAASTVTAPPLNSPKSSWFHPSAHTGSAKAVGEAPPLKKDTQHQRCLWAIPQGHTSPGGCSLSPAMESGRRDAAAAAPLNQCHLGSVILGYLLSFMSKHRIVGGAVELPSNCDGADQPQAQVPKGFALPLPFSGRKADLAVQEFAGKQV